MKLIRADDVSEMTNLRRRGWRPSKELSAEVQAILEAVETEGDGALIRYTRRFDAPDFTMAALRVPIPMLSGARAEIPAQVADAIELARARILDFHERQKEKDIDYAQSDGTRYAFRHEPLHGVAVYAPGGRAVLPSSVLMGALPARLARVERVVLLTPPQRDGKIHPAVLFAASLCEVDELYAVGGAHAIGAAAFGTHTIAPVEKIVGPGNSYVTEAKRQLYGIVGIDGLAGPSEVLVVADEDASSELVVAELLAQAEHDPEARVAVVSESRALLMSCAQLIEAIEVVKLPRGEIIAEVVERGCVLVEARSKGEILATISAFAPEHLSLQVSDPEFFLANLRHVGAVFVGANTPVACGDYLAGSNHVLPTSGAARFSSGLSLRDFERTYSVVWNSEQRMRRDAGALAAFASFEGLEAHAQSARMHLES
ncbi:MAG TPA: histidinol dehydrogenase [Candidatus Dormibacteraeota bacterium]|nr:histidinol dehydrogenase [Candidatus Dormibacteraeota bacterium]